LHPPSFSAKVMKKTSPIGMGFRLFWIILAGFSVSQILGTVHVLLSNRAIFQAMTDLLGRGLLTVPNALVLPSLRELRPALLGGLFFTLTLGAGLTALTLLLVQAIRSLPGISRSFLFGFILLFMAFCLILVNKNGFNPVGSSYFIVLPPLAAELARRFLPGKDMGVSPRSIAVPTLFFLFSLPFLAQATGPDFFHQVRDRGLLSHPWGLAVNDFYYRYTLYAAEAVKSLQQKLIRTYRIEGSMDGDKAAVLKRALNREDLFAVTSWAADLVLEENGDALSLGTPGGPALQADFPMILYGAPGIIEKFSSYTDRWDFFRKGTFHAMILFYPAALFFFIYTLISRCLSSRAGPRRGPLFASGLSFLLLVGGAFLLSPGRDIPALRPDLPAMLRSNTPGEQSRALRTIYLHGPDVASFPRYEDLADSSSLPVRYWFTRCLEKSRAERATALLLHLLEDGRITVATTAIEALAGRGDRRVIPEIRKRLIRSEDWYVQWYAYRALRKLGWCQTG